MLLSTMSYEEIYREILKDFRDVKEYYDIAIKQKSAKVHRNLAYIHGDILISIYIQKAKTNIHI